MHFKAPENYQGNINQLTLDENQVLIIYVNVKHFYIFRQKSSLK